jgi:hypothetical protein
MKKISILLITSINLMTTLIYGYDSTFSTYGNDSYFLTQNETSSVSSPEKNFILSSIKQKMMLAPEVFWLDINTCMPSIIFTDPILDDITMDIKIDDIKFFSGLKFSYDCLIFNKFCFGIDLSAAYSSKGINLFAENSEDRFYFRYNPEYEENFTSTCMNYRIGYTFYYGKGIIVPFITSSLFFIKNKPVFKDDVCSFGLGLYSEIEITSIFHIGTNIKVMMAASETTILDLEKRESGFEGEITASLIWLIGGHKNFKIALDPYFKTFLASYDHLYVYGLDLGVGFVF